jgi:hypothetical protein
MGTQGLAECRYGSLADHAKTFGEREPHQASGIPKACHHPLDLISIISGPFTGSKLLLEYGGQQ